MFFSKKKKKKEEIILHNEEMPCKSIPEKPVPVPVPKYKGGDVVEAIVEFQNCQPELHTLRILKQTTCYFGIEYMGVDDSEKAPKKVYYIYETNVLRQIEKEDN